ncbi:hypothetical protein, partial [Erwinia aphidicola]|uniref:hypothetical protein n=1 Tax=Erwinia aphidicola TaxID=68334 RepID=UPI003017AEA2
HRLSDKLLKSVASSAEASCREVAYITLSSFGVNFFLKKFFRRFRYFLNLLSRWPVSRCAVSVVAHYRDPDLIHNPFFDLFIWLLIYRSFR